MKEEDRVGGDTIFSNQLCNQTPAQILTVTNMAFNVPLLYVNCISLQFRRASCRATAGITINTKRHLWWAAYAAQFTVLEVCGGTLRTRVKINCSLTQTERSVTQRHSSEFRGSSGSPLPVSTLTYFRCISHCYLIF